jgi:hypothetical protein
VTYLTKSRQRLILQVAEFMWFMVGAAGFEPATSTV